MTRSYGQCTFCFRVLPASLHVKLHWHVSQVWILLNTWTKDTILVLEQKTKSSSRSVSYWETTSQLLCIIIRKALWLYELTFIVGKRALEIRYYTNKVNTIKKQAQLSSVLYTFKYTVLKLFAEKSNLNFWSFFFVCFVYLICPNCSVWRNKVIKHLSIKKKKMISMLLFDIFNFIWLTAWPGYVVHVSLCQNDQSQSETTYPSSPCWDAQNERETGSGPEFPSATYCDNFL